jgi:hypothetical protein
MRFGRRTDATEEAGEIFTGVQVQVQRAAHVRGLYEPLRVSV